MQSGKGTTANGIVGDSEEKQASHWLLWKPVLNPVIYLRVVQKKRETGANRVRTQILPLT